MRQQFQRAMGPAIAGFTIAVTFALLVAMVIQNIGLVEWF